MKSFALLKPYFRANLKIIGFGFICLMGVDILQLLIPRVIKWAVDDLTLLKATPHQLLMYATYIVIAAVGIGGLRYGWRLCLIGLSRRIEEGLRNQLFAHLQSLSASFFDGISTGDLMAHATNDLTNIRLATGMGLVAMMDAIFLTGMAIGFMAYIHVKLTILALLPMPLIVIFTKFLGRMLHQRYRNVQAAFSDMTEVVRERFAGIRIIKAFAMENKAAEQFDAVSIQYIHKKLALTRVTGLMFPMMVLFSNISLTIVLYIGGQHTILNHITPGDFVAFIQYLALLTWPMMAMGWVFNLMQRGGASLYRIATILNTAPEVRNKSRIVPLRPFKGSLTFEHVSFAYPGQSFNALTDVSFSLAPGKVLGITGPPGSGKTTLAHLIIRRYDPVKGSVLLDGVDLREVDLEELHTLIGHVPQEPFLFSGSIRENVMFCEQDKGDAELIRAVKYASLYDTLTTFPDGFETIVGEKGVVLSGGQKQRVILARALIVNPPVLILDDPISQVDLETGAKIITMLRQLPTRKTLVMISHRLSAIKSADHILVLDKGRIIESGTHEVLMQNKGYYAKTYRLQCVTQGGRLEEERTERGMVL